MVREYSARSPVNRPLARSVPAPEPPPRAPRSSNIDESPDQALSGLTATPAGVLARNLRDLVLNLKGKLMGIPIGRSASVRQPLHSTFLVAIEDPGACLARNPQLPQEFRHRLGASR